MPPSAAAASDQVAVAVLRLGMGLITAAAATDWFFAAIGGAGVLAMLEGLILTMGGAVGLFRPGLVARLLRPKGRVLVPAVVFAAIGAADSGLLKHYPEVEPAIVWIAAIVSSTVWVGLCVVVSSVGFLGDLALQGHSLNWMLTGAGQGAVVNQIVDLGLNAAVVLLIVAVLRTFVRAAPSMVAALRVGGCSLTPQLALAALAGPRSLLPRANPLALTASLTPAERKVLALLARGRAPKQIARDLVVELPTVRTHIASAKRKTGARTVEQLVSIFVEAGVDG